MTTTLKNAAYDFYVFALVENGKNGVASSGALKMLQYALYQGLGDTALLKEEIEHLAAHARQNIETIYSYAGGYGVNGILNEIKPIPAKQRKNRPLKAVGYERFVIENNLTLSPTIRSHSHKTKYWDNINISHISSRADGDHAVPEIFGMINILKSDYALSRQLLYSAINHTFIETGSYNDTLDYSCYGVNESALALAQRSTLDILDKIAVATLSYLEIGGAKGTSFKQAWFKNSKDDAAKPKELKPAILAQIESGNTALLALTEVSRDLSNNAGFLYPKQESRNSSTHRFTVLHDSGSLPTSPSGCVEHFEYSKFTKEALLTLKLARSALIYFVQMVLLKENSHPSNSEGIIMRLSVPSHEYIRGHEE